MYDLLIIGGGPAGISAGIYASRKQLRTLFITKDWGGQSTVSDDIQNWIGTPSISGVKLAENLRAHLEAYAGDKVDIISNQTVLKLDKIQDGYSVKLSDESIHEGKAVLITSGSERKRLPIPGPMNSNIKESPTVPVATVPYSQDKT